jgi:hypothetical protein
MFKFLFSFLLLSHGLIHFMGFAKAFGYAELPKLTKEISKPAGSMWLATALLFLFASILFLFKKDSWAVISLGAVVASEILIISAWRDARFGTIANAIVLAVAMAAISKMLNK